MARPNTITDSRSTTGQNQQLPTLMPLLLGLPDFAAVSGQEQASEELEDKPFEPAAGHGNWFRYRNYWPRHSLGFILAALDTVRSLMLITDLGVCFG